MNSKPQTYPSFLLLAVRKNLQAMKSWDKSEDEAKGTCKWLSAQSITRSIASACDNTQLFVWSFSKILVPKCPPAN